MRTTLVLEDEVVRRAKHRAVELGVTLSELVNRALRDALRAAPPDDEPFKMVTWGHGEPTVHHEPDAMAEALDDEDVERLGRAAP